MISIIIPAYNEQDAILQTVQHCFSILNKIGNDDSEVIVVDDGSSDDTLRIAKENGAKVVKHPYNVGYGRSLKDGIIAAQNDIIVITDSDGTYPIERIPDLLSAFQNGFDMVVGARGGKNYDESFLKKNFRKILKILVEFTAGRKIADINSGLRIFSKKGVMPYFPTLCETFSFTTSLTLAYMMTGKYVSYIPITYDKRVGKTKVKLFKDSLRTLQFIIEAILYYNPIKIFILFCGALLFLALVCLIVALFTYIKIFYVLGISSIITSFFIFSMGLISVQMKQIISNTKQK